MLFLNKVIIMKKIILLFGFGILSLTVFGQEKCEVIQKELQKGEYIGECKNGLANGKGVFKGENTYEGNFKKGKAHGKGSMLYANGRRYFGDWKNGARHGEGKYIFNITGKDSILEGRWNKNKFIGKKKKKGYEVISKLAVPRYNFRKISDVTNSVTIIIKNNGLIYRSPSNINATSGNSVRRLGGIAYENINMYPFKCEMNYTVPRKISGSYRASFYFEILEPGEWVLTISH